jgi:hypothetical protein
MSASAAAFTDAEPLSPEAADALLGDRPLVSMLSGSIIDMKRVRAQCLEAGIPVRMGCPGGGASCGPKSHLLVAEADAPAVARLLGGAWLDAVAREGTELPSAHGPALGDEPPCPACGFAAPLVDGCCADCGLHLE